MHAPTRLNRDDARWLRILNKAIKDEPITTLAEALDRIAAAAPPGLTVADIDHIKVIVANTRAAWRRNAPWGDVDSGTPAGFTAPPPHTGSMLAYLGLDAASGYAATDVEAEELALSLFVYTLEEPAPLYKELNRELYTKATRCVSGAVGSRLRPFLPLLKLLDEALHRLPPSFVFDRTSPTCDPSVRGRVYRAVSHVFPGYPGCPSGSHVHDPAAHFPVGSMFASYAYRSHTRNGIRVMQEFAGDRGPATVFEVDVVRGFQISKLSFFGEGEAEVLLPPSTQFEVVGTKINCVPDEEQWPGEPDWDAGTPASPNPYPRGYRRTLGPDAVRLRQTPTAALLVAQLSVPRAEIVFGERLGRGSFKDVYRGTLRGDEVALLQLRRASDVEQLEQEAATLAALNADPCGALVRILAVCREANLLVTELAALGNLSSLLEDHEDAICRSVWQQLAILKQVCSRGSHSACTRGVLHPSHCVCTVCATGVQRHGGARCAPHHAPRPCRAQRLRLFVCAGHAARHLRQGGRLWPRDEHVSGRDARLRPRGAPPLPLDGARGAPSAAFLGAVGRVGVWRHGVGTAHRRRRALL